MLLNAEKGDLCAVGFVLDVIKAVKVVVREPKIYSSGNWKPLKTCNPAAENERVRRCRRECCVTPPGKMCSAGTRPRHPIPVMSLSKDRWNRTGPSDHL